VKRVAAVLAVAALACSGEARQSYKPLAVGDAAPDYVVTPLAGDSVSLADLRGTTVMLNVWATWCIPCREEMPAMQRLHTQFADSGLTIIAVSVDDRGSDKSVQKFLDDKGIEFTVARDHGRRVSRAFRTIGVPETFLIDRQGIIVKRWIGEFDPSSEETKALVRTAISG
jgi:peroxiredoxin